jgi:hypothetical protein
MVVVRADVCSSMLSPSPGVHEMRTNTDIANGTRFLATGAVDAMVRGMPSPLGRGVERQRADTRSRIVNHSQLGLPMDDALKKS